MATDNAFKKLFGPFNGLNGPKSALLRELPPAPNAKPQEYATEFKNLLIDKDSQALLSRNGIEYTDTDSPNIASSQSRATSGIFKWIDYDNVTGTGRERGIQLSVNESGNPTVYVYRRIRTVISLSGATFNDKYLQIVEDPDNSFAKRFMILNSDLSLYATYTTLASIPNITVTYYDWDTDRDGAILTSAVDLMEAASLGNAITLASPTFYSLAKKTVASTTVNLSSWVTDIATLNGMFFTAAQASNVIYFSSGVCAMVKYDGQNIYKAGMPNGGIKGSITRARATVAAFEASYGRSIQGDTGGLMGLATGAGDDLASPLGRFVYMAAYERGDAKNNYIEGKPFLHGTYSTEDVTAAPLVSTQVKPAFNYLSGLDRIATVVSGNVFQYTPNSLVASDQFDARAALMHGTSGTYVQSASTTVTVTLNGHGYAVGQSIAVNVTSGTGVDGSYTVASITTNTFTYVAGSSLTTSGNIIVSRIVTTADAASNIVLKTDGTNNTLLAGDLICLRATLLTSSGTALTTLNRLPILITATLSASSATSITIDVSKPLGVELINGGDAIANGTGGFLSDLTTDSSQALQTALTSITTWSALLAFTWLGFTANSRLNITAEFAISNNLRINIYRNKANDAEDNSYDPDASDGAFIPDFYLLNILPNNPFSATTVMGATYDNCLDSCLGALLTPKETLLLEDKDGVDLTATNYSPLPKGRGLSSSSGRLYLTDDPENQNIVWRSDTLYGTEYFRVDDTLNVETPAGDKATICVGSGGTIFVLKTNSVKAIISDLSNEDIRVDDQVIGKYGCIAPRSVAALRTGLAYLSNEGPVYLEADNEIKYLGENENGVSRIKDRLTVNPSNGSRLDLKRAVAWVDETKGHYNLYIPDIAVDSAGLFNNRGYAADYTATGVFFVFDYNNEAWFENTRIQAKGGMIDLEGRMFYLSSYVKHDPASANQGLQWALYKERAYGNLWNYVDYLSYTADALTFVAIPCSYATDWLSFEDSNILKKFLRMRAYGLDTLTSTRAMGSSGTAVTSSGDYDLTVQSYQNWRDDSVQSASTVSLTSLNLADFMKCRNNKSQVMKFRVSHAVARKSPKIQALEIEIAPPFDPKMKRWGTPA